jgi:hypothetical protein
MGHPLAKNPEKIKMNCPTVYIIGMKFMDIA